MLGKDHPDTATSLNNLAELLCNKGDYSGAEPLYRRALAIYEKDLGPEHPNVATVQENMAGMYRKMGRDKEAEILEKKAARIRAIRQ